LQAHYSPKEEFAAEALRRREEQNADILCFFAPLR